MKLQDTPLSSLPTVDVDLSLPPRERWLEVGEECADAIQDLVGEAWAELTTSGLELPGLGWKAAEIGGLAIGHVARMLGAEYAEELRGLCWAAGVPLGKVVLLNLSYDIFQILGEEGQFCSSVSFCDPEGRPILARNLDWNMPETLGAYSMRIRYWKGNSYRYESLGFPGFVGVLSAHREGSWAVTLNQSPCVSSLISPFQAPACMHLRAACDAALSYRKLLGGIGPWRAMSPYFAHVVGVTRKEQCLLQNAGGTYYHHEPESWGLAQTNMYLDDEDGAWVNLETGWDVCERYEALKRRMKKQRPRSLAGGLKVLQRQPVTHSETIQQMVFRPATGAVRLRARW